MATSTTVLNPTTPITISLPGGHALPGSTVVIVGEPTSGDRFCINLIKLSTSHCLLHLDNRFDHGQTVRNCNYPNGAWQHEERGALTLVKGNSFYMEIKVLPDCTQIKINGQYYCDFMHRAPMSEADALQIQGDVKIQMIQFKTS